MDTSSKTTSSRPVGVIGAGSFGTVIANLLAKNVDVLLYARKKETFESILAKRVSSGTPLHERVTPVNDLKYLAEQCHTIFPVVPSGNFRNLMQQLSPYIHPYHIFIHGTKGLDISPDHLNQDDRLMAHEVRTMSQVIAEESVAVRIGCLAGPNLSRELAESHPAATVVASRFNEVIAEGQRLLRNERFQVYGSNDIIGIELCGVLKNIIAIGSGIIGGLGFGLNTKSLLISRGLIEMIYIGKLLGADVQAFIGLAGIGDLIATSTSSLSRNYTLGVRLAKGETLDEILATSDEVAEGVNTIAIVRRLIEKSAFHAPITKTLHDILYKKMDIHDAINKLMKYPFNVDVDVL